MKILCITRALTVGGAEKQICSLASLLREAGHDVTVLSYRSGDFFTSFLHSNGVRTLRVKQNRTALSIGREIARAAEMTEADAVVAFTPGANTKACIAKAIWGGKWKLVVSERNYKGRIRSYERLRFVFYRLADAIVANSHSQTLSISRAFPHFPVPVKTIVNYVDPDLYGPADDSPSDDAPLRIVCLSRVSRRKNLMTLVRAIGLLKDRGITARIDWWGTIKERRYLNKCLCEASRLGIRDMVEIHPPTQDTPKAYREADIFCLPSFFEGTPNTLIEAMASALPVVASDVSDNALYCREGVNGAVFDPSSAGSLADAIEKIASLGRETMRAYGARSRETAIKEFSRERFINEWSEVLISH